MAGNRKCRRAKIENIAADAEQSRNEGPLEHPGAARRVARSHNLAALRKTRTKGRSEPCREVRRDLDVAQAGDAKLAKELAAPLVSPNERHRDGRSALDDLVGPNLHSRTNRRRDVDQTPVANHRFFADRAI